MIEEYIAKPVPIEEEEFQEKLDDIRVEKAKEKKMNAFWKQKA